jgi:hypothetical protein
MPLRSKRLPAPRGEYLPDLTLRKWDRVSLRYPLNIQIEGISETPPWPLSSLHTGHPRDDLDRIQAVSQDLRDPMPLAYSQHQCLPCRCLLAGAMDFQPVERSNPYFSKGHVELKRSRSVITHNGSVEERSRQSIELDSRCVSVVRPDGIDCHASQYLALPTCPTRHRPAPSCSYECQPMLKRWLHQTPFEEPYQPRRRVPSLRVTASVLANGVEPIGRDRAVIATSIRHGRQADI